MSSERDLVSMKECECCRRYKKDVQPRRAHASERARLFCDDCWHDPSPVKAECRHGRPQPYDAPFGDPR